MLKQLQRRQMMSYVSHFSKNIVINLPYQILKKEHEWLSKNSSQRDSKRQTIEQ